jgi:hypothetical protein
LHGVCLIMEDIFLWGKMINQISDGLAVVEAETFNIRLINSSLLDIFDIKDDLNGKSIDELFLHFYDGDAPGNTVKEIKLALQNGKEYAQNFVIKNKKQDKKYIRLNVKSIDTQLFMLEAKDNTEQEKNKLRMNKAVNEAKLTSKLIAIASTKIDTQQEVIVLDTLCKELYESI